MTDTDSACEGNELVAMHQQLLDHGSAAGICGSNALSHDVADRFCGVRKAPDSHHGRGAAAFLTASDNALAPAPTSPRVAIC
jgi:hypothetical protein